MYARQLVHQIRVHLAAVGLPFLGGALYGEAPSSHSPFQRVALHAVFFHFRQPFTGERIQAETPLPGDFQSFLKGGVSEKGLAL